MKCRRCRQTEGTLFYDGQHRQTKTPVCKDCLETLVNSHKNRTGHRAYHGPGRDPDHNHLSPEHIDASEWWEELTNEWSDCDD